MKRAIYVKCTILSVLFYFSFYFQSCRPYPYIEGVTYSPPIKPDTLNKYDKRNRRTGYWVECVNSNLIPAGNKDGAVFYVYDYYDKNIMVVPTMCAFKGGTIKFSDSCYPTKKDTVVMLNGKYKIFDKKSRLQVDGYYKKGVFMYNKRYSKNGQLVEEYVNLGKSNHPFAFSYKAYSKTGEVLSNFYFYSENGKSHVVDSSKVFSIKK